MTPLYLAADPVEAHLLRDHLAAHGIRVLILDGQAWGGRGELSALPYPRLILPPEQAHQRARAEALLRAWERDRRHEQDWTCDCGERSPVTFEHCWSCGADRPA